ncbi:MAG: succinate dehydrogenase, hydrophobic membrane anchor protein [Alphaproteobacteria bacterium]|nr:succinate dehydrogenase, hydrophobic membrane anchor protein [Alphaproteobacteria bacterium]
MTMRSALGRVRGLGSAHAGTHHWWMQRVSALALIPCTVVLVVVLARLGAGQHADVLTAFRMPWLAVTAMVAVFALFWHLKLGLQVVIEDYVHGRAAELGLQLFNTAFCVVLGLACELALLKLAL